MRALLDWYMDNDQYFAIEFVNKMADCVDKSVDAGTPLLTQIKSTFGGKNPSTKISCAHDIGIVNSDDLLGDTVKLYRANIYSWNELAIDLASKRSVNKKEDVNLKPFVLLAIVFSKMEKLGISDTERFITIYECYEYLSVLSEYHELDDLCVQAIVKNRVYDPNSKIPQIRVQVHGQVKWTALLALLVETSIFKYGENKQTIRCNELYLELIHYIAQKGVGMSISPNQVTGKPKEVIDYLASYDKGIFELIPDLPIDFYSIPDNQTRNLYEYLFGVKYGADKLDWRKYSGTDCQGMYRLFYPFQRMVIYKIYCKDNKLGEKLFDYIDNNQIYEGIVEEGNFMVDIPFVRTTHTDASKLKKTYNYKTGYSNPKLFPRNRIYFGAPGTGKSNAIAKDTEELLGIGNEEDYERVTFYPNYSYASFVGTYKPVAYKDMEGNEKVTYEFVPGPFMRMLVKALDNSRTDTPRPFLLIIEEINRANAAAVFGDFFQALDRGNGISDYKINPSEDVKRYLAKELNLYPWDISDLKIPDNMFIWATMNSADQGVQPLDSAFKRRWDFQYMDINKNAFSLIDIDMPTLSGTEKVDWNKIRTAINDVLSSCGVNEDKLIGPYYISGIAIERDKITNVAKNSNLFVEAFRNKVLMYLFEDAGRRCRGELFAGCSELTRYSSILKEFDKKGISIFGDEGSDSRFRKFYTP